MGLKSLFKKVGKGLKKALPYAALAAPFIPGVGPAISGALGTIGGIFGAGSSAKAPPPPQPVPQSDIDMAMGWDSSPPGETYTSPPVNVSAPRLPPPANTPPWWQQALGSLGSVAQTAVPAYLSYMGQQKANQANASAAQAQMDFQASQTGTSYQRAVEDMRKAGLNPMLAYSQGGAASGTGASYQSGSELGAGVASAFQAQMQRQQIASMQSVMGVNQADIQLKGAYGNTELTKQELNEASAAESRARADNEIARLPGISADARSALVKAVVNERTQQAQINHSHSAAQLAEWQQKHEGVKHALSSANIPEAEIRANYHRSSDLAKYDPYATSIGKWASAARDAANALNPLAVFKGITGLRGNKGGKISDDEINMILGR